MGKCFGIFKRSEPLKAPEVYARKAKIFNWGAKVVVVLAMGSGLAAGTAAVAGVILVVPLSGTVPTLAIVAIFLGAGAAGGASFTLFMTGVGLKAGAHRNLRFQIIRLKAIDNAHIAEDQKLENLRNGIVAEVNVKINEKIDVVSAKAKKAQKKRDKRLRKKFDNLDKRFDGLKGDIDGLEGNFLEARIKLAAGMKKGFTLLGAEYEEDNQVDEYNKYLDEKIKKQKLEECEKQQEKEISRNEDEDNDLGDTEEVVFEHENNDEKEKGSETSNEGNKAPSAQGNPDDLVRVVPIEELSDEEKDSGSMIINNTIEGNQDK